jgi:DNA-binding NtrC family response regulator
VDIRLISATNRDLAGLVASGVFREDLLYRIDAIPIALPPLRDRSDDIPLLVAHFLARIGAAHDRPGLRVTPAALEKLRTHAWPGNVRQLINALEYGVITCRGPEIDVTDLPALLLVNPGCSPVPRRRAALTRETVGAALAGAGGSRTAAARALGISRVTLWKRIREFGLDGPGSSPLAKGGGAG